MGFFDDFAQGWRMGCDDIVAEHRSAVTKRTHEELGLLEAAQKQRAAAETKRDEAVKAREAVRVKAGARKKTRQLDELRLEMEELTLRIELEEKKRKLMGLLMPPPAPAYEADNDDGVEEDPTRL